MKVKRSIRITIWLGQLAIIALAWTTVTIQSNNLTFSQQAICWAIIYLTIFGFIFTVGE